jgi:hypothetical protein
VSDGTAATAPAPAPTHRHAWGQMRFELEDGHPVVLETCETCGVIRRYRAFERSWTPGEREVRR